MIENKPDAPTSEQVKRVLQEALLRNYPNPDRTGCRGSSVLREMAEREFPHEHPFWDEHVSHCSPCYREFLDFRNRVLALESRKRRSMNVMLAAVVVLIVAAGSIVLLLRQPQGAPSKANNVTPQQPATPQTPSPSPGTQSTVLTAVLNLESESITRSPSGTPNVAGEVQRIPRGRLSLSIYLPLGSEVGQYEVQLLKNPTDQPPLTTSAGTAQIENGLTILRITPDLSPFEPGTYILAIRRGTGSWRYYRFVLS